MIIIKKIIINVVCSIISKKIADFIYDNYLS